MYKSLKRLDEDNYRALAEAIIVQAAIDYKKALRYDEQGRKREIERFFRSRYFAILTNVSGEMLINKLRDEVKEVVIK